MNNLSDLFIKFASYYVEHMYLHSYAIQMSDTPHYIE